MSDVWKAKTRKVKIEDARKDYDALIDEASTGYRRVVLEKDGVPAAVIISPKEYERMLLRDARQERALEVVDRIKAAFADVPEDELQREIDKAVQEVRQEMREERRRAAKTS